MRVKKGYHKEKSSGKYVAEIRINNKLIKIGRFDTPEEAQEAYREAKIKYHGVDPFKE